MSRFPVSALLVLFFLASSTSINLSSLANYSTKFLKNNLTEISSNIISLIKPKDLAGAADCLGLGNKLAKSLEYIFQAKPNGTNGLGVKFTMSSNRRPRRVLLQLGEQFGLEWTDYDIRRPTKIIVHGFLSTGEEEWVKNMEQAFHVLGDFNVIVVDWSAGGNTINYLKAAVNTKIVGYQIAKLLEQIANTYTRDGNPIQEEDWEEVHCIGHSLGSHICGVASNEMSKIWKTWKFERITGLDPAQPCFEGINQTLKLDKTDAPFVDIIHTNARLWWQLGLGIPQNIGHMDFYPNGGHMQPGCEVTYSTLTDLLKLPLSVISEAICSHGRSYLYFTESIRSGVNINCTFDSSPWDCTESQAEYIMLQDRCVPGVDPQCVEMGINSVNYSARGSFFTVTSASPPYCDPNDNDKVNIRNTLREELGNKL